MYQFGRRVRRIRRLRDLTQEQVAERIERSAEYVSRIERGLVSASFETISRIAGALQVEPRELFDFDELRSTRESI